MEDYFVIFFEDAAFMGGAGRGGGRARHGRARMRRGEKYQGGCVREEEGSWLPLLSTTLWSPAISGSLARLAHAVRDLHTTVTFDQVGWTEKALHYTIDGIFLCLRPCATFANSKMKE